jgi:hypothetical protein
MYTKEAVIFLLISFSSSISEAKQSTSITISRSSLIFPRHKRKKKKISKKIEKTEWRTDSDAVAVVRDLNEFEAAVLDDDAYGGGVGVDAVLHQLLDGRYWPLDHLPGRDAVDHGLVQAVDSGRLFWPWLFFGFHRERLSVAIATVVFHGSDFRDRESEPNWRVFAPVLS